MLKINDKLLCKKDLLFVSRYSFLSKGEFKQNEFYKISYINNNLTFSMVELKDKHGIIASFYTKINYYESDPLYLCDYFYTPSEIRKIKLEKINKNYEMV